MRLAKVIIFVAVAIVLEAMYLYYPSGSSGSLQHIFVRSKDAVDVQTSISLQRECKRRECTHNQLMNHESPNTNTSTISPTSGNHTNVATPTTKQVHNFATPATSDHSCARNRTQGYLLAVQYDQQLSGSFNGFSQLSKIASLLNLSTVEPYIHGTGITGVPEFQGDLRSQNPLKLATLYDVHHLQSTLKSCCALTQLVSFEKMLENTSHNIIFVYVFNSKDMYFEMFFDQNPNTHKIIEIGHDEHRYSGELHSFYILERWASHVSKQLKLKQIKFRLSRIVAVDARPLHPLHLSNITNVLGSIIREEVEKFGSTTVVLNGWRGIHNSGNSSFFYYIPEFSWDTNCGVRSIRHSEAVVRATHQFSQTLNGTRPVIGVHIRGERLLTESKGNITYYTHCLQQLNALLKQLAVSKNVSRESIHVFHDLGDYGSMSCTLNVCVNSRHKFVSLVKGLGYPIVSFDPTMFYSVPVSNAFAAFVEREYLAHVDVLVTVGRGGFQQSIVERFMKYYRKYDVHRICSSRLKRRHKKTLT